MSETKQCPYCSEDIDVNATVCPICGEMLDENANSTNRADTEDNVIHNERKESLSIKKSIKNFFAPVYDSIYWEQANATELVFKYRKNDITLGSILTVRESQEAYFFKNGVLCDKFTAGRHKLATQNLPILNKLIKLPSGGETTFLAEVWFVSMLEKRNMLWGTGGMRIIDPYFQIPVKVSSRGQYGFRISDGATFLKKLVGTMKLSDTNVIEQQFRSDVIEAVKTSTAKYMKEQNLNINEIATEYKALAKYIANDIQAAFDEYGIELLNFNIEDINIDENDPGYKRVMEGVAENARLRHLGVSYVQQKQIDIAETAAGNEGAGNFMGIGMGLGAGQQLGQMVAGAIQQSGIATAPPPPPPAGATFYVAQNGQTTGPFDLAKIREMIVSGLITKATYVYRVGGTSWNTAEKEAEIAQVFASLMPPPLPPTI